MNSFYNYKMNMIFLAKKYFFSYYTILKSTIRKWFEVTKCEKS